MNAVIGSGARIDLIAGELAVPAGTATEVDAAPSARRRGLLLAWAGIATGRSHLCDKRPSKLTSSLQSSRKGRER